MSAINLAFWELLLGRRRESFPLVPFVRVISHF